VLIGGRGMGHDGEAPAIACSDPPTGRSEWSLRLLADRLVELSVVDSISYMTVIQCGKGKRIGNPGSFFDKKRAAELRKAGWG
ncbi:MAG: hypothetical protein JXA82_09730, partial [Sedimentisphaerales bacterium]|nr:hypothetical protein [Sedimentisphaerales bacterium]